MKGININNVSIISRQDCRDILSCKSLIVFVLSDLISFARPISFLHKPQGTRPLTLTCLGQHFIELIVFNTSTDWIKCDGGNSEGKEKSHTNERRWTQRIWNTFDAANVWRIFRQIKSKAEIFEGSNLAPGGRWRRSSRKKWQQSPHTAPWA